MSTASTIAAAEASIERGDYGQCLALLEPLAEQYPLQSREGAQIRMIMITAWMGQGYDQKAITTCRALAHGKEPEIRQQAKQLISILEAPDLPRPENWSVKIPRIDLSSNFTGNSLRITKTKIKEERIYYPPTGPTKAFDIGFATLLLAVLSILTILLTV
tara:strand:+ start:1722 stop:2201 length:480 start_codon:yes stop_codon:yes gene_type:complete